VSAPRPRAWAALVLFVVFVLGALVGVVGAGIMAHHHIHAVFDGSEEEVETRVSLALLDRLLRLSNEEREQVREVLARNAAEHTRLRASIEPSLASFRDHERTEIRSILTPEQRVTFDVAIAKIDARRRRVERLLEK
jgi:hypothetical protein